MYDFDFFESFFNTETKHFFDLSLIGWWLRKRHRYAVLPSCPQRACIATVVNSVYMDNTSPTSPWNPNQGSQQGNTSPMGSGMPPKPPMPPSSVPPKPATPSSWPQSTPVQQAPKVPEMPPRQTIQVRTMGSDVKSMGRGDAMPIPESVMAPVPKKEIVFSPETQNQVKGAPSQRMNPGASAMEMEAPSHGSGRKMAIWISSIVVLLALVLVGYFFVYPMLFPEVPPPPVLPPPPPPAAVIPHASYFVVAPSTKTSVSGSVGDPAAALAQIQALTATPIPSGNLQEIEVKLGESQMAFSQFFSLLGTTLSATDLSTWFEDDFTAFTYYDDKGVWPGYVAKAKAGITPEALTAGLMPLETSDLSRMYLIPLGDPQGGFKDGTVNGKESRYVAFSTPGAAFSYTILDGHVLFSTSYDGAKKAATHLGF